MMGQKKKADRRFRVVHAFPRDGVWWTRRNEGELASKLSGAELDELVENGNIVEAVDPEARQEPATTDVPEATPTRTRTRNKE